MGDLKGKAVVEELLQQMVWKLQTSYPYFTWTLLQGWDLQTHAATKWGIVGKDIVNEGGEIEVDIVVPKLAIYAGTQEYWSEWAKNALKAVSKKTDEYISSLDQISNKTGTVQDQHTGGESMATGDWTQVGPTWTSSSEQSSMPQHISYSPQWKEYTQTITLSAEEIMNMNPPVWPQWLFKSIATDIFKTDPLYEMLQSEQGSCLKPSVEVKAHHNGCSKSKEIQKRFIENGLV